MKRRIRKALLKLWHNTYFKILFYVLCLVAILAVTGRFSSNHHLTPHGLFERIMEVLKDEDTIAFFTAGIMTLIVATIVKKVDIRLEEGLKINDDHHKIISTYSKHKYIESYDKNENFYFKDGAYMTIDHVPEKRREKNHVKDHFSSEFTEIENEVNLYNKQGRILLPSLNVFTNIKGDVKINFEDQNTLHQIPDFVMNNVNNIISAHKYSKTSNNLTVRLDDFNYLNQTLTLKTERSYYFHMLLTNRCMDYKLPNGMTIRGIYEFSNTITPLNESKLGNQIGINGVVITSDNYLLIEKRDRKKTTWRNKFAQPISLAFKFSDTGMIKNAVIAGDIKTGEEIFRTIIKKTLKSNFNLSEEDFDEFSLSKNFLGIARDLLEGGKPNLYFALRLNKNAKEIKDKIEKYSSSNDPKHALKTGKLTSRYYLMPYDKIKVDFNYVIKIPTKEVYRVNRILYPRVRRYKEWNDKMGYFFIRVFKRHLRYECGEALLVSLAYLEICQDRLNLN